MEKLSLITTPIYLWQDDTYLGQGTGFFVAHDVGVHKILFLITNYHVLTGSAPHEGKASIGNKISFNMHLSAEEPELIEKFTFPLYSENGEPTWLVNEDNKEADLAIIPIPTFVYDKVEGLVETINKNYSTNELKVRISSKVTLIGYPRGYFDEVNSLPIWKVGNIASEPEMDFNGKKVMLVDASVYPGMSGSPVFAIQYGMLESTDGTLKQGRAEKFLGIFASERVNNDFVPLINSKTKEKIDSLGIIKETPLQLGHVWKAELIFEVLDNFDAVKYMEEVISRTKFPIDVMK